MAESTTPVFDSIFGPVKAKPLRLDEVIDFSDEAGNEEGTNVIHVREPSPQLHFKAAEIGEEKLKRHAKAYEWPKSMRESVALLALCHNAPLPNVAQNKLFDAVLNNYVDIAADEERGRVIIAILKKFGELFPQYSNMEESIKLRKNSSSRTDEDS